MAASWEFRPSECQLPSLEQRESAMDKALAGRKIAFLGDSLIRQVMIAWACRLHSLGRIKEEDIVMEWQECGSGKGWTCENTKNCITCGPHSGAFKMRVKVQTSGAEPFELVYGENLSRFGHEDITITEAGMHHPTVEGALRPILKRMQASTDKAARHPTIVHMVTWNSQFPTKDGIYDVEVLEAITKKQNNQAPGCTDAVNSTRPELEINAVRRFQKSVLWLDGTNSLGKAKVGGSYGAFGDCLHFCMPGPVDEIATSLEWLTIQTMLAKNASDMPQ